MITGNMMRSQYRRVYLISYVSNTNIRDNDFIDIMTEGVYIGASDAAYRNQGHTAGVRIHHNNPKSAGATRTAPAFLPLQLNRDQKSAFLQYKRLVSSQISPGFREYRPVFSAGSGTFGALTKLICGSGQKKPSAALLFQIIHCL